MDELLNEPLLGALDDELGKAGLPPTDAAGEDGDDAKRQPTPEESEIARKAVVNTLLGIGDLAALRWGDSVRVTEEEAESVGGALHRMLELYDLNVEIGPKAMAVFMTGQLVYNKWRAYKADQAKEAEKAAIKGAEDAAPAHG